MVEDYIKHHESQKVADNYYKTLYEILDDLDDVQDIFTNIA